MIIFYVIIGLILLVCVWGWLDVSFGKRQHKKQQNTVCYPSRQSNVDWFDDGKRFFDSLFRDISEASNHVYMLFFVFRDDSLGSQLIDLLSEKAAAGVEVIVLVDRLGAGLKRSGRKRLEKNGVQFAYSQKPTFPFFLYSLNRRNHRKITVIDGKTGYLGGFNVGDEYLGRDPKLAYWRDFHCRFHGTGVQDLTTHFLKDWNEAGQTAPRSAEFNPHLPEGRQQTTFISTDGHGLVALYEKAIREADRSIYIASPYFIPPRPLQQALTEALKRGVKVHIILPEKKDHPFVKEASFYYLRPLLHAGASVYHYQLGFYHAKAFLTDDHVSIAGTANFDRRSFCLNNEMNTIFSDDQVIRAVKHSLLTDMKQSTKVTLADLEKTGTGKAYEKIALCLRGAL
ncbi:phospholipase D-like domain-containing protein [Bacillus piscicola]|uniref:phospholipase D-like domain-containing protein n=1 Tax=Bacillus piscicola TaxID=1632684 RepID=UPI001F0922A8|nr:phospholipase D-like domain-containing protein [Bacillus piscicola]